MSAALRKLIPRLKRAKILVVGDVILDEYLWGGVSRISPEAPVPVVLINRDSVMPGGAANVASNVRALGGGVAIAGITGDDAHGRRLRAELVRRGVNIRPLLTDRSRPTTVKTRIVAHHQQVVRIDREQSDGLSPALAERFLQSTLRALESADGVIIEDYGKGVISPRLLEMVIGRARKRRRIVTVDPKEGHFQHYTGVTSMTPNRAEAGAAAGIAITDKTSLYAAGDTLLRRSSSESVLITLGEEGMCLFRPGQRPLHVPTVAQEVFDVAGAGDTVIATFTLALAAGADMDDAARLANVAAGIVVGKVGTAVVTPAELAARVSSRSSRAHR